MKHKKITKNYKPEVGDIILYCEGFRNIVRVFLVQNKEYFDLYEIPNSDHRKGCVWRTNTIKDFIGDTLIR